MADYKSAYTGAEIDDGIAKARTALQSVPNATHEAAGLLSASDKAKLDGVETGANKYTLPKATAGTLGGVKVGTGLAIADDGTLSATGGGSSGGTAESVAWDNVTGKPSTFTPASHTHNATDVSGLADVATSGSYNDLTDKPTTFTPEAHTHEQADITGLQTALDGKSDEGHSHAYSDITDKPSAFPPETHTHAYSEITDKPTTFAPEAHTHEQSEVNGLATALEGKADASHTHEYNALTGAPVFAYDSDTQTLAITV